MGYDIFIGQAELELEYGQFDATVKRVTNPHAPTFANDELTAQSNRRSPSYSTWADFCRETGLYELFYDEDKGLIRHHPGCFALTKEHSNVVNDALLRWMREHPGSNPGFEEFRPYEEDHSTGMDYQLARLLWLDWWMKWALENCSMPAVANR